MKRVIEKKRYADGAEVEVVEDDRLRTKGDRVEVRGTWVLRGPTAETKRPGHTRKRPR